MATSLWASRLKTTRPSLADRLVVYLHGTPGAPEELAGLGSDPDLAGLELVGLERHNLPQDLTGQDFIQAVARRLSGLAGDRPIHLVGFSMGGCIALRVAALGHLPIVRLDLIAPAGPLELGDPAEMAGGALFLMAAKRPGLFRLITDIQALAARFAPQLIYRALFSTAQASDQAIAADPGFRSILTESPRAGFGAGYVRDMLTYVEDWGPSLAEVRCPTHVWQGDRDNWVPPALAEATGRALPNLVTHHRLPEQSHYGALKTALPRILDQVRAQV